MTVEQILTEKGYDYEQLQDIVYHFPGLDAEVRSVFGIDEPIHLFEKYYIGDADEDSLNKIAEQKGLDNYVELLSEMDRKLIELAENFPARSGA